MKFLKQIQSTVGTGTSPLSVSSTTLNTNLNADMLDGNHASAFYLATNPSGYTSNNGTVTSVSVASANGFAGTVANSSSTPAITLSTTITGLLKGNGTAISAAVAGTDYVAPSGSITGTAANVTGTVAIANGGTGATSASGARTNLGLGTAAISSSTDFVGRKSLSNTGLDYTDFVIPLCSLDNTSISANYYAYGSFYMKRSNILSDQMTKIDIICGKNYNSNTPVFSINKTNSSNLVRPVTFTYNSVMYFGLHFYITASSYDGSCLFFGTASDISIINGIQIYNNNTSTIINSEIYNSLSFLTDTTYNKAHEFYKSPIIRPVGGSTTYKIWNETNDGAGSGLDADTLDGNHASAFYLATNPNGYTANTGTVTSITAGSYLTGGTITGSGTLAVDATTSNTPSKVVARDPSGNFSAGTITATNFAPGVTIQTTTGTTQTLTANSSYTQVYNGTTAQTIKLASATSGASFRIINNTSTSLYIITNGGASILTQIAGVAVEYIVIDNTTDVAASWMPIYLNRTVVPVGTNKYA